MRTFDSNSILPPFAYEGGNRLISLRAPCHWYIKRVVGKGKNPTDTNLDLILPMIVDKMFGDPDFEEDKLDLLLNLDCIVGAEAEYVKQDLEARMLAQVLAFFPKIGAEIPRNFYLLKEMDLLIDVPNDYEDQRGYFF